jgi:hypothetical protein
MSMPIRVDELTPEWLSSALSVRFPRIVVESVDVESVIWGTATKVFLRVGYARRPDGADRPGPSEALCVKGGFQDELREVAGVGHRQEAGFYRDIAPHLGVPLPRTWYADLDDAANQGLVVFDDLRVDRVEFGRAGMAYSVDEVAAGLELQAIWHGRTWKAAGPGATPWLTVGSPVFRHVMAGMFHQPAHWDRMLGLPQTDSLTGGLRDRERMIAGMHRQWALDDAGVQCLAHGDAHIGNTYRVPGETGPRFLDWQVFSLGSWSVDVSYFLVGSLTVDNRRRHEESLLRHYLEVLAAQGVVAPTFDEAIESYRRHHLHGVMWAFCPPEMQDPDDCAEMARRHVSAAVDHDTMAALEV